MCNVDVRADAAIATWVTQIRKLRGDFRPRSVDSGQFPPGAAGDNGI
jgi:hypothetical protein